MFVNVGLIGSARKHYCHITTAVIIINSSVMPMAVSTLSKLKTISSNLFELLRLQHCQLVFFFCLRFYEQSLQKLTRNLEKVLHAD